MEGPTNYISLVREDRLDSSCITFRQFIQTPLMALWALQLHMPDHNNKSDENYIEATTLCYIKGHGTSSSHANSSSSLPIHPSKTLDDVWARHWRNVMMARTWKTTSPSSQPSQDRRRRSSLLNIWAFRPRSYYATGRTLQRGHSFFQAAPPLGPMVARCSLSSCLWPDAYQPNWRWGM